MKFWAELALATLRDPQATARQIMDWHLGRTELYLALIAVTATNAFLAGTANFIAPAQMDPATAQAVPMLALLERPLVLFVLIAGGLVVTVHALFWAGRAMGGGGSLSDMLALLTWLQALRAAAQAGVLLLSLAVPVLGGLVALGVAIVGFWLLLHFISAALRLDSLFRAFGILLAVMAGLLLGLMLLVTMMGLTAGGLTNV
ncbi:YIP1 family protein [uncultured Tateyamaria sp.]|uniref:YIP1 family protein n=1 Tax=Tateyamaria sp. TaxID=1929288 RepID=UPI0026150191|nr:YIP1 family protein [uncultured Tateyamaria sp.]